MTIKLTDVAKEPVYHRQLFQESLIIMVHLAKKQSIKSTLR